MGEAFITRRGGGGGPAGLNFEVVGGTVQPAKAKENTIWVNTAQEITSYDFAAEMPFLRSSNKNKIVYPFYHTTRTENGITWTDNGDGSITANGTAASDGLFRISTFDSAADHEYLEAGTYTLSGCPAGGSASTYLVELFILNPATNANEAIGRDYGEGFTFTLERGCKVRVNLNVMSGATVSGITFRPQIEKGSTKTAFVKGDATGQVWITTGTSNIAEFNALKKNGIQVYPISAKQYISGAWVDKTAKSYQGGVWVDWVTYLLNGSNLCEDITGGWTQDSVNIAGQTNNGTVTFSKDGIALSCGSSNVTVVRTKNKIDFSGKKKLTATMKATTIGTNNISIRLYIIDGLGNVDDHDVATIVNVTSTDFAKYTIEDISNLNGAYYVALVVNAGRAGACKNIFLE